MAQFESSVKVIPYSQHQVYNKLSDLSNLEGLKDKLPADKLQDFSFDSNTLSFSVPPVGKITLRIIEREPDKCVKFETVTSPLPFNLWIQLVPDSDIQCKMKLTIKAELNPFIKGMIQKPLQDGLEKIAEMLSQIPY
ncbi:MAG: SRPBCC family protein [Bacteroides sp.]